ncbi:putative ABC transporter permease [Pseudoflavonifractor gallinarum]|uniref:putative ABC transporter permease n=1 Tax=Eubacteriales TaxID=186802 RepID=UPI000C7942EF|nr:MULTISPECIES: putative ABC transporter permease [Eubacteriales]MBT9685829.1 hypothetical protein [Pseudoflavonifractor sp. MCC625]
MREIYPILWYFFVYAFLGWCSEVCYAALRTGKFVNRGFLNGPLCPIYGFGVVLVTSLLAPVRERFLLLFLCSVVLCSALEWVTGFVLEKLFHQKWWDYSDQPFNLNGYICPLFSLLWGFACLIIMDMIHPAVMGMVRHIPRPVGLVLLVLFLVLTAVDLSATVASMIGLNKRLRQLEEMAARIKAASNELGENLADATLSLSERGADLKEDLNDLRDDLAERGADLREDLTERLAAREAEQTARRIAREAALKRREAALAELKAANEELLSTYGFGQRRLLRAFPHMTSTRYAAALEELRRRARGMRKKDEEDT